MRSLFWSALSLGSSRVAVFLVTLGLTRLLAPEDFGVVAAGLTLITFLEIALDLGLGATVVYEQEEGIGQRVRTAYTLNLLIAAVLAGGAVLAAPAVAAFFRVPDATNLLRVLFCYLLLRGASQVQTAVLQRDLRYRERTYIDVTRAVIRGGVSLSLAATGSGPWAIVIGMLAGEVAGLVLSWYYVRLVPTLALHGDVVRALLKFGVAAWGLKVVSALWASGETLAIGNRLGPTDLGFYNVALRLPELTIDSVFWIFSGVSFSLYAKARAQGMDAFRGSMLRALRLVTLFGFSAGTGLAIIAPTAVPLLFSAKWEPAVEATVILSLATALGAVGYASGDIFPAVGRPGLLLHLTAWMTGLSLVAYWFLAPQGIAAVAWVVLAGHVVFGVLRQRLANKLVGTTWRQVLSAMVPAAVTALGVACFALPVSLLMDRDALGLVLTILAGLAGAGAGIALAGRSVVQELAGLLRAGLR